MSMFIAFSLLQAAAGATPATIEPAAPPDDAKIVCKTLKATGSRLGGERVCMSKKAWRRFEQESEVTTRYYQDRQSKQPGNQ